MMDTMIGVDLAKNVFQLHGASLTGEIKFRKKLTRVQFQKFIAKQPACIIVFEACGGAHYWAHEAQRLGHHAKLIAPQYVKPFVKRQKNDAADAEAIVIAAQRPEMRFVEAKSSVQIARGVVFRARDRLVRQRPGARQSLTDRFLNNIVVEKFFGVALELFQVPLSLCSGGGVSEGWFGFQHVFRFQSESRSTG